MSNIMGESAGRSSDLVQMDRKCEKGVRVQQQRLGVGPFHHVRLTANFCSTTDAS